MALYLGIDLSTQGVKAELIDPENPAAGSGGFAVNTATTTPNNSTAAMSSIIPRVIHRMEIPPFS